ncbi:MAG: DNA polymerase I [Terriglobia bacterium]
MIESSPGAAVAMKKLFLIDGMSHLFRAFYAIRGLSNAQGVPTNAVFGFASMLRKLMRQYQPEYIAVVLDGMKPTFRHEAYEAYKANRAAMPEDLARQLPFFRRFCEALRLPILEIEGYEADDIIGTLARRAEQEKLEAVIVSNDKDMFQLVNERVRVLHQAKADVTFDSQKVEEIFGVPPRQVVDVLGLMGDSVDNVPGAPGIGEKGARDLIKQFGSIDRLLEQADQVNRKAYRESLQSNREQILQSRELVTIHTAVPLDCELQSLRTQPPDLEKLKSLFGELGFQSLLREYEGVTAPTEPVQTSFDKIESAAELRGLIEALRKEARVYCYVALEGEDPMQGSVPGLAFAGEQRTWQTTFSEGTSLRFVDFLEVFSAEAIRKVIHNAKTLQVLLLREGGLLGGFVADTMLMSYLIQPNRSNHQFEEIIFAHLQKSPEKQPAERCVATRDLFTHLQPKIEEEGLDRVFQEIEKPLSEVLAAMEFAGIRVDCHLLNQLSREFEERLSALTVKIYELAGTEFNINSPKQLGEILFEKLNLPAPRKLKKSGQYSTSVEILEQLAQDHELPGLILDFRQISKLKTGYVDALPRLVNPGTGRVHTSFNQTVAATGRLSSSNPNLQNIPVRSEMGTKIRAAFIPTEGCILLAADYSQIELRVLAHLSEDPVLLDAFQKGEDIHSRTAAEVFGIHPGLQGPEIRRRAKAINFGIIYGQTAFGLAKELEISSREAQEFIKRYFEHYRGVKDYIDRTIAETRQTGVSRTLFGRLRQIPEINSKNPTMRGFAERTAVNSPIQGTAADLIKLAMIRLFRKMKANQLRSKMLLQVHDELVFDVPLDELPSMQELVKTEMESVSPLRVPLVVEIGSGVNWMET